MVTKNALRAGTVTAGTTLTLLLSSPAFALTRDDGDDPGSGLSVGQTLGLYVGIPLLACLVIAGLVMVLYKPHQVGMGLQTRTGGAGADTKGDKATKAAKTL
ncbi:hypothetical protein ACFQLX_19010 [Streptomyces polyrhachis]|uniref:Secreted protein n=1 Tax=Streptomyces polyrhachis TaxID=1282885 RepID=A0ABW2GM68_9ACTN